MMTAEYQPAQVRLAGDFDALAAAGRLWRSSVELVGTAEDDYRVGAVVPSIDRVPVSAEELKQLWVPDDQADVVTVHYLQASEVLYGHIARLRRSPGVTRAQTASRPNQLTTTYEAGQREGLHLDNHEQLPLDRRYLSLPRLGVNLGPGDRYVLFGSLTIFAIMQQLEAGDDQSGIIPSTEDVQQYVRNDHIPRLTVYWLRLDPGDAYVAPTELCVHDGSTLGVEQKSVIAFIIKASKKALLPPIA
jgi:hypothetical protein